MRNPRTPDEWQLAVDGAKFYLGVDAARQYGLITGGPKVNAERCQRLLELGKRKGYTPAPLGLLVDKFLGALIAEGTTKCQD
jgi:hypothetical protein